MKKKKPVLELISDLIWNCSGVRQWAGVKESGFSSSIPWGKPALLSRVWKRKLGVSSVKRLKHRSSHTAERMLDRNGACIGKKLFTSQEYSPPDLSSRLPQCMFKIGFNSQNFNCQKVFLGLSSLHEGSYSCAGHLLRLIKVSAPLLCHFSCSQPLVSPHCLL